MINYEEIIEQLDDDKVKQLLDKLNIPFEDKGSHLMKMQMKHHKNYIIIKIPIYFNASLSVAPCPFFLF